MYKTIQGALHKTLETLKQGADWAAFPVKVPNQEASNSVWSKPLK